MSGKGNIFDHHQQVGHCDSGQDDVDWVPPHVPESEQTSDPVPNKFLHKNNPALEEPVCEDEDVDDVEDDADDADGEGKVTVHRLVELLIQ